MTTWTGQNENTSSYTNQSKSDQAYIIPTGTPMGLLLLITYAQDQSSGGMTWTGGTKNSSSYSNTSKNSSSFSNRSKNSTSFTAQSKS